MEPFQLQFKPGTNQRGPQTINSAAGRRLSNEFIVLRMSADPEPQQSAFDFSGERAVREADADRAIGADLLEVQRWMSQIGLEKFEVFVGKLPNRIGKSLITGPELGIGEMFQSSRVL